GARDLTPAAVGMSASLEGKICNTPAAESDWYRVTTAADGDGLVATLTWTARPELDVYIYAAEGRLPGPTSWLTPENVTVTHLPAGTSSPGVYRAGMATAPAYDYTREVQRTAVMTCTTSADCAATYQTQLYRGACNSGVCEFIPAGMRANGTA